MTSPQVAKLARMIAAMQSQVAKANTAPQLPSSSIVDGTLDLVTLVDTGETDADGEPILTEVVQAQLGTQADGSQTLVVLEGPEPPAPVGVYAIAGPESITVGWAGAFADNAPATLDHDYVAVHVAEKAGVDGGSVVFPSNTTLVGTIKPLLGGQVTLARAAGVQFYVGLVAVTQANKWSTLADVLTVTPLAVEATGANGKPILWGTVAEMEAVTVPWVEGSTWFNRDAGNAPNVWRDGGWVPATFNDGAIGNLNVAKLVGDTISGNFVLAGSLKTDTLGARVENDRNGIRVYDNNEILKTDLNSSGSSTFNGQIQTSGIEVNGRLKLNSDSEVSPGTDLVLLEGYSAPATQPMVTNYWDTTSISGVSDIYGITRDPSNGDWVVSSLHTTGNQMRITRHDGTTGALISTVGYVSLTAAGGSLPAYGVAIAGGKVWVGRDAISGTTRGIQIVATDGTTRTFLALAAGVPALRGIGQASGDDVAVSYREGGDSYYTYRLCTFNTSTSAKANVVTVAGSVAESAPTSVAYGTFDLGHAAFAHGSTGVGDPLTVKFRNPADGSLYSADEFPTAGAWLAVGYYDGKFWATRDGATIHHHTADKTSVPSFAYSWYDADSGGTGVHETGLSPWSSAGAVRAKWEIVTGEVPAAITNDSPNAVRVVASVGGTIYLQGTLTSVNALALAAISTATVYAKEADFPASATPGTIRSASGHIVLPGVGRPVLQGINVPVELGANLDLDTVQTPGVYIVGTSGLTDAAAQALHYPLAGYFLLEVLGDETYPVQRLMQRNAIADSVFTRRRFTYLSSLYWSHWATLAPATATARMRATISTDVAKSSGTSTITGWTAVVDTAGAFVPATGVYTIPTGFSGYWTIAYNVTWATQSTRRMLQLEAPGGTIVARAEGAASGYSSLQIVVDCLYLTAGQTILPRAYAAAAATIKGVDAPASFSARYLGPAA